MESIKFFVPDKEELLYYTYFCGHIFRLSHYLSTSRWEEFFRVYAGVENLQFLKCLWRNLGAGELQMTTLYRIGIQKWTSRQDLFDRVVKYIIENMGKTFSASSIAKFLKNEHRNRKILDGVLENLW